MDTSAETGAVEILRQTSWTRLKTNSGQGGLTGMVTEAKIDSTIVYIRENLFSDTFMKSSNQRWGEKLGSKPTDLQVLELCAPNPVWNKIAKIVRQSDALNRSVRRNRQFTEEWAKSILNNNKPLDALN
jgi:hypothetical protein